MSVVTSANFTVVSTLSGTSVFGAPTHRAELPLSIALESGTTINKADKRWISAARSLGASTSENLDLAGSLTDQFGATITFARIKLLIVQLITATAGYTLEVGGAASNAASTFFGDATDKLIIRGGGFGILYAPDATAYAITAGTGDILKVNNPNAAGITYNIELVGASA
jgi:hypothetical protein